MNIVILYDYLHCINVFKYITPYNNIPINTDTAAVICIFFRLRSILLETSCREVALLLIVIEGTN